MQKKLDAEVQQTPELGDFEEDSNNHGENTAEAESTRSHLSDVDI